MQQTDQLLHFFLLFLFSVSVSYWTFVLFVFFSEEAGKTRGKKSAALSSLKQQFI